jgi:glycosyltransferase involved in cell wall biosynthesis
LLRLAKAEDHLDAASLACAAHCVKPVRVVEAMKVCLVSLNALPALSAAHKGQYIGGAEVQLTQLAVALAVRGHEVSMIVADAGQPDGAVYEGVTTLTSFKPSAGLPFIRFLHPRWTKLWSAASRADADVYLYSCAGFVLGLLALYCRLHGRRLVYRLASDADCDLKTALIKSGRDRWLYRYGLQRTDAVLVQSIAQQAAIERNFGRKSTVVRGLVEGPRSGSASTAKDIDVLWLANLRHLKRPDRLLDLAEALPQFSFHMAGGPVPGDEAYYRQIESRAHAIPNVTFHGKVPYMDVGRLFDRAKVFTNTSEVEGFPNTFLQAWARGIPVVTLFDPDGLVAREALGSSHREVADMAPGLRRLLVSPDAYSTASSAALRYMDIHFGEGDVLAPYLNALQPGVGPD